jgi:hypothetical protein
MINTPSNMNRTKTNVEVIKPSKDNIKI